VFLDEGYCSAAAIELDPDTGCATYSPSDEATAEEDWDEEEEEWEEDESEEEDDELWDDEEDEF
jgi:hypothetical protein